MTIKDKLINERKQVDEGTFKLRKIYSRSITSKVIYLVVEGKDDEPYYASVIKHYLLDGWKYEIVSVQGRENVIHTYTKMDWTQYPKKQILFFVDRDLSDFTGEVTPHDDNIYVTDNYSIENDIFQCETYIDTLKYYYGLSDLDEEDNSVISKFFNSSYLSFQTIMTPIMSWILYWRMNDIACELNNISVDKFIEIRDSNLVVKSFIGDTGGTIAYIHSRCGVAQANIDISPIIQSFLSNNGPDKFIRGKFIKSLFVLLINHIHASASDILVSRRRTKTSIPLGYGNAIQVLCGIMCIPPTLRTFISNSCVKFMNEVGGQFGGQNNLASMKPQ